MIKRVFLVFFTFLSLQAFSQESVFISTTHPASCNRGLLEHIKKQNNPNEQLDLLVEGNGSSIENAVKNGGGLVKYNVGNIYSIRIKAAELNMLLTSQGVLRVEGYHGKSFILDVPADSLTFADSVKQGAKPLTQPYTGKGVVMGFIDVGIDTKQTDFMDSTGKTRIKYLWSQVDSTGGTTPSPFGYGQEWTASDIDGGTCTFLPDTLEYGHGSNVAGAGCGNGHVNPIYTGIAPQADIISVNVNLGDNSLNYIADAANYIYTRANTLGEPCSINASVGSYRGSHDGNDLPAQMIAALLSQQNGRAFSCASGDAGGIPLHLGFTVQTDSAYCWFKNLLTNPANPINLIAYELWANKSQFDSVYFQFGADLPGPSFTKRGHTRYYNITKDLNLSSNADSLKDSIYVGPDRLGLITVYVNLVEDSVYDIFVVIVPDSTTYLWRLTAKGSGYFDCWTNISLTGTSNILKTGLPSVSTYPDIAQYRLPGLTENIISSYGCLNQVITVGNYVDRSSMLNYDDAITSFLGGVAPYPEDTIGAFFGTTSIGPTRDGRIKPDITAPGANIVAPGQLNVLSSLIRDGQANKVAYRGNYNYNGGTSLASPLSAGVCALLLQKDPNASWGQIKSVIEKTALQDQFTGSSLPNIKWGYGKLNAFDAEIISLDTINTTSAITALVNHFVAFPNPTSAMANIYYELANNNSSSFIQITDLSGGSINMIQITGNSGYYTYDMSQLAQGVYLCRLISGSKTLGTLKLMKQ